MITLTIQESIDMIAKLWSVDFSSRQANDFNYNLKTDAFYEITKCELSGLSFSTDTDSFESFGDVDHAIKSIDEKYNSLVEEYKTDVQKFTELILVINHKSWQYADLMKHFNGDNASFCNEIGKHYAELYYKCRDLGYELFPSDKDQEYMFNILD